MKLRHATVRDYTELVQMYKGLCSTVYHDMKLGEDIVFYGAVIEWFRACRDIVIAETDDGNIAGFTLAYVENILIVEPYYYCDIAYVKQEYRKSRAAYMLYNNCVNYAKELGLRAHAKAFIGNGNKDQVDKIQGKFATPEFIEFRTKGE